jgi:hypothetical protein
MASKKSPTPRAKKVDSVDKTAKKDETKVVPSKAKAASANGGVRLDPNLRLIPGNAVTFVAEGREGRTQAKIITSSESWIVATSSGPGEERVSKILERPGEITVEFYEDGKKYASGTWQVG